MILNLLDEIVKQRQFSIYKVHKKFSKISLLSSNAMYVWLYCTPPIGLSLRVVVVFGQSMKSIEGTKFEAYGI